jgi:serine/threonine protein kinase
MSTTTDSISVQAAREHPIPEYVAGQILGGKYEVIAKIGEGLLGTVYKVKHRSTQAVLALKILRPRLVAPGVDVDTFNHLLQGTKRLTHPGVVHAHDAGDHEGTLFFTMDLVEGKTVRDLMDEYKQKGEDVSDRDLHDILVGTLDVLQEAHKVTLHRDLKPENIFLVPKPEGGHTVRLADFSIAMLISPTIFSDSALNRDGAFYMAPEMSEFRDKAEANADLYSLGAIFYELLLGTPPAGQYELPSAIRPDINRRVDDIIEIALAPNPQDRFQSAADMLAAVNQAFSDLHGGSTASLARTLLLLAVLAVVLGIAAVYFRSQKPTEGELYQATLDARDALRTQVASGNASPEPAPAITDGSRDGMVWISGGTYISGGQPPNTKLDLVGERAPAVTKVEGFWIEAKEPHYRPADILDTDTDAQKAEKEKQNQFAFQPIGNVTWTEATEECARRARRLCTEDEWEKACKGSENWHYTYGDKYDDQRCPPSGFFPPPYTVNQFPLCMSADQVWGLGGGLMEWTSSVQGTNYVVKGGARTDDEKGTRCAGRADRAANYFEKHIGFRCCAD